MPSMGPLKNIVAYASRSLRGPMLGMELAKQKIVVKMLDITIPSVI
jgi:hypothetical protein